MQPLLTNVTEYSIEDIAKVLPIGKEMVRRYIQRGELKATLKRCRYMVTKEDLETFMVEKGFTNLNL